MGNEPSECKSQRSSANLQEELTGAIKPADSQPHTNTIFWEKEKNKNTEKNEVGQPVGSKNSICQIIPFKKRLLKTSNVIYNTQLSVLVYLSVKKATRLRVSLNSVQMDGFNKRNTHSIVAVRGETNHRYLAANVVFNAVNLGSTQP